MRPEKLKYYFYGLIVILVNKKMKYFMMYTIYTPVPSFTNKDK